MGPGIDLGPDVSTVALQALRFDGLYFNVAGAGPTFPVALDAAERWRRWLNGVAMFSHDGYAAYNDALDQARQDLAAFIGDPGGAARIALTQSATEALNVAIGGLSIPAGSTVLVSAEEHASALLPVYARAARGDRVVVASVDELPLQIERLRPAAVVVSLVSCRSGRLIDVPAIAAAARAHGGMLVCDAAQALGQVRVDVTTLGADAVALLGHKWLHGPLATGALWVADPERLVPTRLGWRSRVGHDLQGGLTLQPDATRFEAGTVDAAAFVGLRQALAVHRRLGRGPRERVRELRRRLFAALADLPYRARSAAEEPTGIVVVEPRGGDAAGIVLRMWTDDRVVVKHLSEPGEADAIRISFWALHSAADIDRLAGSLAARSRAAA